MDPAGGLRVHGLANAGSRRACSFCPPRPPPCPRLGLADVSAAPDRHHHADPTATPTSTRTPTTTSTATRTPTVTPTATPGPIASALGFSNELIAGFDAAGYTFAGQQIAGSGRNRVVAFIVEPPSTADDINVGDQVPRLLIYRYGTSQPPQLLFEDEGSDQTIQFAGLGYTWEEPLGWGDINGDGLVNCRSGLQTAGIVLPVLGCTSCS